MNTPIPREIILMTLAFNINKHWDQKLDFWCTYCQVKLAQEIAVNYTYDVSSDFEYIRDTIEVFSSAQTVSFFLNHTL